MDSTKVQVRHLKVEVTTWKVDNLSNKSGKNIEGKEKSYTSRKGNLWKWITIIYKVTGTDDWDKIKKKDPHKSNCLKKQCKRTKNDADRKKI